MLPAAPSKLNNVSFTHFCISLTNFVEPAIRRSSPRPVSYTHLDVYKRQVPGMVGVIVILACDCIYIYSALKKAEKRDEHFTPGGNIPVSYTHLDVYKRQYCYSRFGLFRVRSPLLAESLLMSLPRPT